MVRKGFDWKETKDTYKWFKNREHLATIVVSKRANDYWSNHKYYWIRFCAFEITKKPFTSIDTAMRWVEKHYEA